MTSAGSAATDDEDVRLDGRAERRERNRASVVEALLDLYREGHLAPSAELIARTAGVSPRSLFRYFDDVDALVREAVAQQQARLSPMLVVAIDPALAFDRRVADLIALRLDLYDAMGSVARVARAIAAQQPRVATELGRIRAVLREQVAAAFAPELAAKREPARGRALAAADVLASWESFDLLRSDQGLAPSEAAAAVSAGLTAVLL
jgi:AcrR family transcriptional regulator